MQKHGLLTSNRVFLVYCKQNLGKEGEPPGCKTRLSCCLSMVIKFCPNCGNKLIEGAAFCPSCGYKVQSTPVATNATTLSQETAHDLLKKFGFNTTTPEVDSKNIDTNTITPAPVEENSSEVDRNPVVSDNNTEELVVKEGESPQSNDEKVEKKQKRLFKAREAAKAEVSKPQRTRPKRERPRKKITDRFLGGVYEDEMPSENENYDPIIIKDDLYNKSIQDDYDKEVKSEIEEKEAEAHAAARRSRSANTISNIRGRAHKASSIVVDKTAAIAGKHLIADDKTLGNRKKVYIIEQEEMADPDDPSYDGYYENILPIDDAALDKGRNGNGQKFTLNEESKKTIVILIGLLIALIVVITTQF